MEAFGASSGEAKKDIMRATIAAALINVAFLALPLAYLLGAGPVLGWILLMGVLIVDIIIVMYLLDCSLLTAILAIIIWAVLRSVALDIIGAIFEVF